MNEGYLQRLTLLEQRLTVARNDFNKALNEFADTLVKMQTAHRMFQIYVDENLRELREKCGLSGSLLTDSLEPVNSSEGTLQDGGKEL